MRVGGGYFLGKIMDKIDGKWNFHYLIIFFCIIMVDQKTSFIYLFFSDQN